MYFTNFFEMKDENFVESGRFYNNKICKLQITSKNFKEVICSVGSNCYERNTERDKQK